MKKENKKSKNGKLAGDNAKSGSKKNNRFYCSKCGHNGCWKKILGHYTLQVEEL